MNRVSILDYALMSADIYHRKITQDPFDLKIRKVLGHEHWHRINGMSNEPMFGGDLFSRLYIHFASTDYPDMAVVAYRGTLIYPLHLKMRTTGSVIFENYH